jgi:hypothetical protein
MTTHKHILTFEGNVPQTERERAAIWGPEVSAAIDNLRTALATAGFPHTVESKITKPKASSVRKPRAVRAAAE